LIDSRVAISSAVSDVRAAGMTFNIEPAIFPAGIGL
jgi:hypothetical protein